MSWKGVKTTSIELLPLSSSGPAEFFEGHRADVD